jgi:hypothetical protein
MMGRCELRMLQQIYSLTGRRTDDFDYVEEIGDGTLRLCNDSTSY